MELFGIEITTDIVISVCMVCCTVIAIIGFFYTLKEIHTSFKEIHTSSHDDKEDEE